MKVRWLVIMLVAVAMMLVVAPNGMATHQVLFTGGGSVGFSGNPVDAASIGFGSDYIGDDLVLRVSPSFGLDVEICFSLILLTNNGGSRRELGCSDRSGKGGDEALQVHINSSAFPNFNWRANALLVVEVWAFSGRGSYSLQINCC